MVASVIFIPVARLVLLSADRENAVLERDLDVLLREPRKIRRQDQLVVRFFDVDGGDPAGGLSLVFCIISSCAV